MAISYFPVQQVRIRDRSSALICWLTACWAMCRSSAARVKLRRCATAAKVRNWRNSKPWPDTTLATLPRRGPAATSYACYTPIVPGSDGARRAAQQSGPAAPVTLVLSREVRAGHQDAFENVLH